MLQARLVVLALLATAWSCCGDIYPFKERRRTRAAKCFHNPQDEFKPLAYGGGKSVSIAYQDWSSYRTRLGDLKNKQSTESPMGLPIGLF